MVHRYAVLDVFTEQALAGNPLAVVFGADDLDTGRMQAIAREFALSETVFVMAPTRPAHTARVRIFTPARELPFAGHPTVGTAVMLGLDRFAATGLDDVVVVLEEEVGTVRCAVRGLDAPAPFAEFDLPKLPQEYPVTLGDKATIADALGLTSADIGFENHRPVAWTAGTPFAMIPLAGLDAMSRVRANLSVWKEAFGDHAHNGAYLYCRDCVKHDSDFHARMIAPSMGISEDPATGAAAAAFVGQVNRYDTPGNGTHRYRIEQGVEMGRPSLIELEIVIEGGAVTNARIGGHAVKIAEGTLEL